MSIESKNYVATPADVERLAVDVFNADSKGIAGRTTYLRALVGTVQAELGAPPRKRTGAEAPTTEEECAAHLKAFDVVALRFYTAVLSGAKTAAPGANNDALRSMTGFARSAASTVRGYIKAMKDIRLLAAKSVTKRALAVPRTRRKLTVPIMRGRISRLQTVLLETARNLFASNRESAREILTPLLAELAKAMGLAEHTTKRADVAEAEHRPWQTKTGVFIPLGGLQ